MEFVDVIVFKSMFGRETFPQDLSKEKCYLGKHASTKYLLLYNTYTLIYTITYSPFRKESLACLDMADMDYIHHVSFSTDQAPKNDCASNFFPWTQDV